VSVEEFARLSGVLDGWCEREGRDPATVRRAVNLSFNLSATTAAAAEMDERLRAQWGPAYGRIAGGALLGTPDDAVERVLAYVRAGAQDVNVALRAPWDQEALDAYVGEVVPAVRQALDR
jgi:alkanesulfonate monooxygenase SsuD/methylene tetrahydromethanopterin reductase-like flavin-dependent oxidoreductase (luciferase family)